MDRIVAARGAIVCFRFDLVELRRCCTLRRRLAATIIIVIIIQNRSYLSSDRIVHPYILSDTKGLHRSESLTNLSRALLLYSLF